MNLGVIGTGYVGLVAGTCFAESGNDVTCVDIDEKKISALKMGRVSFYEPGLEELVRRNLEEQRLSFTTDLKATVRQASVVFIAVGTPQGSDGAADIEQVLATAKAIGQAMDGYRVIVNKSTVPAGTADRIRALLAAATSHPFAVVANPEFLKEGAAVEDFMKPDRVVLGGDDSQAIELVKELYEPFVRTGNPILIMDARSAEMSKYAANGMLAAKISFINNMAGLPDGEVPQGGGGSEVAAAYQQAKIQKDAVRSSALASLKQIQLETTSGQDGEHGHGDLPLSKQYETEIKRYAGNTPEYQTWARVMAAQNDRGAMVELLKIKALDLSLQERQYRQWERMEAQLASAVAAKLKSQSRKADAAANAAVRQTATSKLGS
ncbi:MAG: hypothetical protein A2W73_07865 [Deltaproteobacteria bacterium RIFCSPLOWO2_12_55_13]|nr:MAG: hypothetical protein A2W73_07865 [Deltaproteobacteria bacterium RIFCSPLOWO2_12_55_13]